MWLQDTPEFTFIDIDGESHSLKEMRDIPVYTQSVVVNVNNGDMIDEIASRPEVYGEGSEDLSYKIFEANIITLFENDFSLTNIKKLLAPRL